MVFESLEKILKHEIYTRNQKRNTIAPNAFNLDPNKNIIYEYSEYWKYMYSGSYYISGKDGLLPVLIDSIDEIKKREWHENEKIVNIFMKIKEFLMKMKESLHFLESFYENEVIFFVFN